MSQTNHHPYAISNSYIVAAAACLRQAEKAHTAAYYGDGSDTTPAAHIRATIRNLQAYLAEVGLPITETEEEHEAAAHKQAAQRYEDAKRAHQNAIRNASAALVANHRAQTEAAAAAKRAAEAKADEVTAEQRRIQAAHKEAAAEAELQRHQDARDSREEEAK